MNANKCPTVSRECKKNSKCDPAEDCEDGKCEKEDNSKKEIANVKLSTKMMKSSYEQTLMKAMLQITATRQTKVREKVIKMDFELSPNLNSH